MRGRSGCRRGLTAIGTSVEPVFLRDSSEVLLSNEVDFSFGKVTVRDRETDSCSFEVCLVYAFTYGSIGPLDWRVPTRRRVERFVIYNEE
jgi:hypothetical protein